MIALLVGLFCFMAGILVGVALQYRLSKEEELLKEIEELQSKLNKQKEAVQ